MGELTPMERAQRALAQRTSRRGFLGRVGRGVVALAGGSLVATALAPDRAEAYHICGHTYTTGSCPHPYAPLSRTDRYGFPVHPTYGYPVDDRGKLYRHAATQVRSKTCQDKVRDIYPSINDTRYGGGWTRCCSGRLRHISGLLLPIEHPDQRRLCRARVLPSRVQGLLHHVPGAHPDVLTDAGPAALAIAAAVAGWSALWGP